MIRAAWRDLQFRRRRFAVALVGASLVFSLSVVIQGLAESFDQEATDTLEVLDVGRWVVADRATGPFNGFTPLTDDQLANVDSSTDGASPLLIVRQPIGRGDARKDAIVVGATTGQLGTPTVFTDGRGVAADGEAVVSERAGIPIGSPVTIGGAELRVVGTVGTTLMGGTDLVFTTLGDAQEIVGAGPAVTAVAIRRAPSAVPAGLKVMNGSEVRDATLEPLQEAIGTIAMMRSLLWVVAALIVGAILYLNAMERSRDVAVMKAIGVESRSIAGSMLVQAVIVGLVSALVADVIAVAISPAFPMNVTVTTGWLIALPVLAVTVSCVACLAAIRRALSVSPATAFAGP